jgi:hypothetical protein
MGVEPTEGTLDEDPQGGVDAIGGHNGFEMSPEIFAGVELGRAKGQPGDADANGRHPLSGSQAHRLIPNPAGVLVFGAGFSPSIPCSGSSEPRALATMTQTESV